MQAKKWRLTSSSLSALHSLSFPRLPTRRDHTPGSFLSALIKPLFCPSSSGLRRRFFFSSWLVLGSQLQVLRCHNSINSMIS